MHEAWPLYGWRAGPIRHDLARRALVDAPRRRERGSCTGQVSATPLAGGEEQVALARLAHDATGGDAASARRFAAAAARQASALGAHRQAAAHSLPARATLTSRSGRKAALLEGGSIPALPDSGSMRPSERATGGDGIWRELNNAAGAGVPALVPALWYDSKARRRSAIRRSNQHAGVAGARPGAGVAQAAGVSATNRATLRPDSVGPRPLALAEQRRRGRGGQNAEMVATAQSGAGMRPRWRCWKARWHRR